MRKTLQSFSHSDDKKKKKKVLVPFCILSQASCVRKTVILAGC